MTDTKKNSDASGAWYSAPGADNDVVLSTRVRLARNLANFPFPGNFRGDDGERVQTLVFDAFSHAEDPDRYQVVETENLDEAGAKILAERGVLDNPVGTGLVMRSDGRVACTVNSTDHVRIVAFVPGLDCNGAFALCRAVDVSMQQHVQFAASYDFGFLTASVTDTGSGMKISIRMHLPSLSHEGRIDNLVNLLQTKGISLSAIFGNGNSYSPSLGAYYQVSTISAFSGSEIDQLVSLTAAGKYIIETERKLRAKCAENKQTIVRNIVYRAYALMKFSRLVTFRDAVEIISGIKWGYDMGFFIGITATDMCALLYRVRDGHLEFLLKNGSFKFEKDIEDNPAQRVNRLRSLILQEAFENTEFVP